MTTPKETPVTVNLGMPEQPKLKYQRRTGYYPVPTHEFNLPAGWACPGADGCLTKADRHTGKRVIGGDEYICYASSAERFPAVRDSRWDNFQAARHWLRTTNDPFPVPARATHIRIHGSGDFFNAAYFRRWCDTAAANPDVRFWAFTKSVNYWLDNADHVPPNLEMNASLGSKFDNEIREHGLKSARVVRRIEDVPADMPIDYDDSYAMHPGPSFALLNNAYYRDQPNDPRILAHNARITRQAPSADS